MANQKSIARATSAAIAIIALLILTAGVAQGAQPSSTKTGFDFNQDLDISSPLVNTERHTSLDGELSFPGGRKKNETSTSSNVGSSNVGSSISSDVRGEIDDLLNNSAVRQLLTNRLVESLQSDIQLLTRRVPILAHDIQNTIGQSETVGLARGRVRNITLSLNNMLGG